MVDQPYSSFADYLARNAQVAQPRKFDPTKITGSFGNTPADTAGDVLSSFVDLLSRGLFSQTERIDSFMDLVEDNESAREKIGQGDVLGGIGESLASGAKFMTAPIRGMFSTDPDDKRTTSDLIERGTDMVGTRTNPGYVDTENNVNPVLKGVVGFAGDVAMDPLTYLSMGTLGAAGGAVRQAVRSLRGGGGAGAAVVDDVARAADNIAEEAPVATPELSEAMRIADAERRPAPSTPPAPVVEDIPMARDVPTPPVTMRVTTQGKKGPVVREFTSRSELTAYVRGLAAKNRKYTIDRVTLNEKLAPKAAKSAKPSVAVVDDIVRQVDEATAAPAAPAVGVKITATQGGKVIETREFASKAEATAYLDELTAKGSKLSGAKGLPKGKGLQHKLEEVQAPVSRVAEGETPLEALKKAVDSSPNASAIRQLIDEIVDGKVSNTPNVTKLEIGNWLQALSKIPKSAGGNYPKGMTIIPVKINGKWAQLSPAGAYQYARTLPAGPEQASLMKKIKDAYDEYAAKFDEAPVDPLGNPVVAAGRTPRERFLQLLNRDQDSRDRVDGFLGAKLVDRLERVANPATFEAYILAMRKVLDEQGVLDNQEVFAKGTPIHDMLAAMGINVDEFIDWSVKRTDPVASHVADAVEEGLSKPLPTAKEAVKDLDKIPASLSGVSPEAASILKQFVQRNLIDPKDKTKYPYATDYRGVNRDAEMLGEGLGADVPFLNTHSNYDLLKLIRERVFKEAEVPDPIKNVKLSGTRRAEFIRKRTLELLKETEAFLLAHRAPVHFDAVVDGDLVRVHLTLSNLIETLDAVSPASRNLLSVALFNGSTFIPATKLMEAAVLAVRGADEDTITALLRNDERRNLPVVESADPADEKIVNWAAGDKPGRFGHLPRNPRLKEQEPPELPPGASALEATEKGWYFLYEPATVAMGLAGALRASAVELSALMAKNADALKLAADADQFQMSSETIAALSKLTDNFLDDTAAAAQAAAKPTKVADDVAKAKGAVRPEAVVQARVVADAAVPTTVKKSAEAAVKQAEALKKGDTKTAAKIQQKEFEDATERDLLMIETIDASRARMGLPPITPVDDLPASAYPDEPLPNVGKPVPEDGPELALGKASPAWQKDPMRYAEEAIQGGIARGLDFMARTFHAPYGLREAVDWYLLKHKAGGVSRNMLVGRVSKVRDLLNAHSRVIDSKGTTVFSQAFYKFQKGTPGATEEEIAAIQGIKEVFDDILGTGAVSVNNAILSHRLFRSLPEGIPYLNDIFKQYKVLGDNFNYDGFDFFDMTKVDQEAVALGYDKLSLAAQQWRDWDIKDPADFLSRVNAAAVGIATDTALAQSFVTIMNKSGLASAVPKPGYVRIKLEGQTRYGGMVKLFAGDKQYFPIESVNALKRLDELAMTSRGLNGEVGQFITKTYVPVLNAWKYAITMPRPGHHIRNFFGNVSMTYLAEGSAFWNRASRDAFKMMALRKTYTGFDAVRALDQLGENVLRGGGEIASSGKMGEFSYEDLYRVMQDNGLLPDARVLEDVFTDDGVGKLDSAMRALTLQDTKFGAALGKVSEANEHFGRISHFMQIIHKANKHGGFKSQQELFDYATNRVLKYHPDVTLLTMSEQKYARLIIPFYSWMKPATIALFEAILTNPARVNVFNKASYNLAVSMGLNPDSLYDPFPTDQLFPSFLTEDMEGPQFKIGDSYFRVNPGFAPWDISNTLKDPVRGIAGMTSPIFRVPLEMLSGGSWGTGARINDQSDYLDASIPGVNYVSNMTGTSLTGSLASLLQGQGFDPQLQFARGNKDESDQALSAFNWLTGLGVQDLTKPNYINFAEIERRNEAGGNRSGF